MEYKFFRNILNKQIFESSKSDLLEKLSKYPERYIGLFRPTKPKAKILQNLLQSNEIRFGDALEIIFE
jgi:Mg2+ and Co2+ transporter CorA